MSPINIKKLSRLRRELNYIDDLMLNILDKRTKTVKKILKLKKYKNEIVDRKRIKEVLNRIKRKSRSKNIDVKISQRIWKNMIWSYIDFEKRNFKKK